MPELPEVEVTRRGLAPLAGRIVTGAVCRCPRLREPVPDLGSILPGMRLSSLSRRSKYLVWCFDGGQAGGWLLTHLGMSGSWRVWRGELPEPGKHDHVDIAFEGDFTARLTDPRRFGLVRWCDTDPLLSPPLSAIGPEPWDSVLDNGGFHRALQKKGAPMKAVLLSGSVIAGCGNIYASESLFRAGIHPELPANMVSEERAAKLLEAVRAILAESIEAGGSTLRDFHGAGGEMGMFALRTAVYGREGEPCRVCGARVRKIVQSGRATFFCPQCQRRKEP